MRTRGIEQSIIENLSKLHDLEHTRKLSTSQAQALETENNHINSKIIPGLKRAGDDISSYVETVNNNTEQIKKYNLDRENALHEIKAILEVCPNLPIYDSEFNSLLPSGDEDSNLEVRKVGIPRIFDGFEPLAHEQIGHKSGEMDFEQTVKISGPRFVTLKNRLARLERALVNFMLDIQTGQHGYEEVSVPYMVRAEAMYGVGQLPKMSDASFIVGSGPEDYHADRTLTAHDSYRLISTGEVPLTNLVREKIISERDLPLRYTCVSPCFRSEIGSSGRDVHGIIRLHQFMKVELVSIVSEEEFERVRSGDSESEHERMTRCACHILDLLGLPYKVMLLASGDTGFGSMKTYDLEVWMPSQGKYREISSCSYYGDFAGRRMNARYKNKTGRNVFVHTLNGSGLPLGRTIAAIMENYQTADGSFEIPEVLKRYME